MAAIGSAQWQVECVLAEIRDAVRDRFGRDPGAARALAAAGVSKETWVGIKEGAAVPDRRSVTKIALSLGAGAAVAQRWNTRLLHWSNRARRGNKARG